MAYSKDIKLPLALQIILPDIGTSIVISCEFKLMTFGNFGLRLKTKLLLSKEKSVLFDSLKVVHEHSL